MNNNNIIIFTSKEDGLKYFQTHYGEFIESIPEPIYRLIGSIQGQNRKTNNYLDLKILKTLDEWMMKVPRLPDDIEIYRGGIIPKKDRTYVSASWSYEVVKTYGKCEPINTITVRRGARIFPFFAKSNEVMVGAINWECEIFIDQSHLHPVDNKDFTYEYY